MPRTATDPRVIVKASIPHSAYTLLRAESLEEDSSVNGLINEILARYLEAKRA